MFPDHIYDTSAFKPREFVARQIRQQWPVEKDSYEKNTQQQAFRQALDKVLDQFELPRQSTEDELWDNAKAIRRRERRSWHSMGRLFIRRLEQMIQHRTYTKPTVSVSVSTLIKQGMPMFRLLLVARDALGEEMDGIGALLDTDYESAADTTISYWMELGMQQITHFEQLKTHAPLSPTIYRLERLLLPQQQVRAMIPAYLTAGDIEGRIVDNYIRPSSSAR